MKKTSILLFSLVFTIFTFGQSNFLQEGNSCFAKGDYACAITKYKIAINLPDARQKKIAGDNLRQAEKCFELQKMADAAYAGKNFIKAKEYYASILNENPNDENAKAKLNEIKNALITLSVSKNSLLFLNAGGTEIINVTTDADSYTVGILPSWCTLQKFQKYFSITCSENLSGAERTGNFMVTAGGKSEIINIRQYKEQSISLSVSKAKISIKSSGGYSEQIFVNTNAPNFSALLLPSWCSVQTYKDYFIVICKINYNTQSRSDWFKIKAENKEVKIYITQEGNNLSKRSKSVNSKNEINKKDKYFFANIGVVTNDPKELETVMVTMGGRKFYVRIKFNPQMLGQGGNYSTNFLSNELEITNTGRVKNFPSSSGYYYVVSDQMESNRRSATLGTSFGRKKLRFYIGGGYGERFNFWGINLYSYSNNQDAGNIWAKNINQSWKGIEAEGGFFLKLKQFNIMSGVSTIFDSRQSSPFLDFHLGLGFSTR